MRVAVRERAQASAVKDPRVHISDSVRRLGLEVEDARAGMRVRYWRKGIAEDDVEENHGMLVGLVADEPGKWLVEFNDGRREVVACGCEDAYHLLKQDPIRVVALS